MNAQLLQQARLLSVEEQIELVEALWCEIEARDAIPAPSRGQKAELDRRLADYTAAPDDVVVWDDVKAEALSRIGR